MAEKKQRVFKSKRPTSGKPIKKPSTSTGPKPGASRPKPSASRPASKPPVSPKARKPTPSRPASGGATRTPAPRTVSGAGGGASGEEYSTLIRQLDMSLSAMGNDVSLSSFKSKLAELQSGIVMLAEKLAHSRNRGYRYKNYLERKCRVLQEKWVDAEPSINQALTLAEAELMPLYDSVTREYSRVSGLGASGLSGAKALEGRLDSLKTRVNSAEAGIRQKFSSVEQTYYQTERQIEHIGWILDQVEQSGFNLLSGENIVEGVAAKWWRDGKDKGPEGNLYLTDQRIIFEQKEKVATKKILFVTTESEMVQEVLMTEKATAIESVTASSKGLMGQQDHIDVVFSSGDFVNAHFHLKGQPSEEWVALVKRVQNGDIMNERYYEDGEAQEVEVAAMEAAISDAPTQCSSCGAPFDEELVRGQRQMECEYCGGVMRW